MFSRNGNQFFSQRQGDGAPSLLIGYFFVLLFIFCIVELTGVGFQANISDSTVPTISYNSEWIKANLCNRYQSVSELSSIVWSHRARNKIENEDNPGKELKSLLHAGITHFDIDVTLNTQHKSFSSVVKEIDSLNVADFSPLFIVAHPSESTSGKRNIFLTLREFLKLVHEHQGRDGIKSFVTIEPKFSDVQLLQALMKIISDSPMMERCALIVATQTQLKAANAAMEKLKSTSTSSVGYRPPLLAFAYRSRVDPSHSQSDAFKWQREQDGSHPGSQDNLAFEMTMASTGTGDGGRQSTMTRILMPDVALLSHVSNLADRIRRARDSNGINNNFFIVTWLVDDEEGMFKALQTYGMDGMISNQPIKLFKALKTAYRSVCN